MIKNLFLSLIIFLIFYSSAIAKHPFFKSEHFDYERVLVLGMGEPAENLKLLTDLIRTQPETGLPYDLIIVTSQTGKFFTDFPFGILSHIGVDIENGFDVLKGKRIKIMDAHSQGGDQAVVHLKNREFEVNQLNLEGIQGGWGNIGRLTALPGVHEIIIHRNQGDPFSKIPSFEITKIGKETPALGIRIPFGSEKGKIKIVDYNLKDNANYQTGHPLSAYNWNRALKVGRVPRDTDYQAIENWIKEKSIEEVNIPTEDRKKHKKDDKPFKPPDPPDKFGGAGIPSLGGVIFDKDNTYTIDHTGRIKRLTSSVLQARPNKESTSWEFKQGGKSYKAVTIPLSKKKQGPNQREDLYYDDKEKIVVFTQGDNIIALKCVQKGSYLHILQIAEGKRIEESSVSNKNISFIVDRVILTDYGSK